MLINLSNHPSKNWETAQIEAASQYGEIIDITFPNIPPYWDTVQVEKLSKEYFKHIKEIKKTEKEKPVIHIAGEPVFCFLLINILLKEDYIVFTSTTERIVEKINNEKISVFKFKKFRKFKL